MFFVNFSAVQKWTAQRKLDYLGVPLFYGFGLTDFKGRR